MHRQEVEPLPTAKASLTVLRAPSPLFSSSIPRLVLGSEITDLPALTCEFPLMPSGNRIKQNLCAATHLSVATVATPDMERDGTVSCTPVLRNSGWARVPLDHCSSAICSLSGSCKRSFISFVYLNNVQRKISCLLGYVKEQERNEVNRSHFLVLQPRPENRPGQARRPFVRPINSQSLLSGHVAPISQHWKHVLRGPECSEEI